ncbi:putative UDP-N-acetylglucosamine--peptide N-acetylglucosaminyltransferase SEC [Hibiscus syriacus]|uniref:protein O-GlcNAc transferase n=1 Tax=Hibiscus syriacus TaxID=106335 RepID=A0A6A3BUN7_HIBSY|nr:putative UDP-N-acetylglucosamine--peptide N-acetylglucosaminyltransferase SEC [Hibiscus syriacus]
MEAISCYNEVLRIDPVAADGLVNRGNTYKEIGSVSEAIQDYICAINIQPNMAEAHANLASAYKDSGRPEATVTSYKQALLLRPEFPEATCNRLHKLQKLRALSEGRLIRKYAAHSSLVASRVDLPPFNHPVPIPIKRDDGNQRLKVGYVFCYALSQNDGTGWRQHIRSETEHFIDVSAMTSDVIAKMINNDGIQILINLNGYTKGVRNEIFAMQPAPIQVSYMGFPGTTGADYIDYLVTDEFVSPLRYAHIYSEKLVHLPHCYFVNDYKQKNRDVLDPNCQHKRSDYGLPEDKFIFAYAVAQGVQPEQIIFTDVAMKHEHIRRSALADLCLDTPLCNSHTTGTDVLWAGLPMVTLPLEKMAARVAGSLCLATGLGEEMIVNSMKEYEERAVTLALNRQKLQTLTIKLKLHSKKRNRFTQFRLNDMVFVKFNRALERRAKSKEIDPILLQDIDESNEWFMGRMEVDDETMFVGEDLTWSDVANAFGAYEPSYLTRASKVVNDGVGPSRNDKGKSPAHNPISSRPSRRDA